MEITVREYEYQRAITELDMIIGQLIVLDTEHKIQNVTRTILVKHIQFVQDYLGENKDFLINKETYVSKD